jgi:hypothetical protein
VSVDSLRSTEPAVRRTSIRRFCLGPEPRCGGGVALALGGVAGRSELQQRDDFVVVEAVAAFQVDQLDQESHGHDLAAQTFYELDGG